MMCASCELTSLNDNTHIYLFGVLGHVGAKEIIVHIIHANDMYNNNLVFLLCYENNHWFNVGLKGMYPRLKMSKI